MAESVNEGRVRNDTILLKIGNKRQIFKSVRRQKMNWLQMQSAGFK